MIEPLIKLDNCQAELTLERKREYLSLLSDLVWDIEAQLAQAKAERARLMRSLQADIRQRS
jgi:hypothetical protein